MAYGIDNGLSAVDVSKTVTAVHQTDPEGHYAAHTDKRPDHNINLEVAGARFPVLASSNGIYSTPDAAVSIALFAGLQS